VPWIEDGLILAERAPVLANQPTILTEFNPLGIGADLDRAPDGVRGHRVQASRLAGSYPL
jgi:hypothetical protein